MLAGSLTSQLLANFHLGRLDCFVSETLQFRRYVRYINDIELWHSSREVFVGIHDRCKEFARVHLAWYFQPGAVQRNSLGIAFQGCRPLLRL